MAHFKAILLRYGVIDQMIKTGTYPSADKIMYRLRDSVLTNSGEMICKSTLEKDICRMKEDYDAPIRYSRTHLGYIYSKPYDFGKFFLDECGIYVDFKKHLK